VNARDAPLLATSSIGTPSSCDMFPRYEKITKPAKTLVRQLPSDTAIASL
jgi:hypothetical protein